MHEVPTLLGTSSFGNQGRPGATTAPFTQCSLSGASAVPQFRRAVSWLARFIETKEIDDERDPLPSGDARALRPRPVRDQFGGCCAEAAAEVLVSCSLRAGDAGTPYDSTPAGDLCRNRGTTDLPLDERSSCAPLLGVHGVHALSPRVCPECRASGTRRCSLIHARHTRTLRPRTDRASLRGPVRRLAGRLLQRPRPGARNPTTPARFRSLVAPIAARLTRNETTGCTGG